MNKELREKVAEAIFKTSYPDGLWSAKGASVDVACKLADAAIAAMPPVKFNLIEHLKGGGKAVNEAGEYLLYYSNNIWLDGLEVAPIDLMQYDWKPHVEPELADGWYWVVHDGIERPMERTSYEYPWVVESGHKVMDTRVEVIRNPDGTPMKIKEPGE